MENELHVVDWNVIMPAEALEFRARWDAAVGEREAWLRSNCPAPLDHEARSLQAVWDWFMDWVKGPMEGVSTPAPVFWAGPLTGSAAERRYAGVEAVVSYLEQVIWRRHPDLVPSIARTPAAGQTEVEDQYAPGLDWAPRVKWGATVDTGSLATRLGVIHNGEPEDRPRRADWLPWYHATLEEGLAVSKKELKRRKPPAPKAKVSKWRDPDDPTYSFEVWFEEETLDDHPTVADTTAEMLSALNGIDEAFHHDRNAILVAGPIKISELRAALKKHLAQHPGT